MIAIEPMARDPVVSFACIKTLVTIEYVVSSVLFPANLYLSVGHKIGGNYFDSIHKLI